MSLLVSLQVSTSVPRIQFQFSLFFSLNWTKINDSFIWLNWICSTGLNHFLKCLCQGSREGSPLYRVWGYKESNLFEFIWVALCLIPLNLCFSIHSYNVRSEGETRKAIYLNLFEVALFSPSLNHICLNQLIFMYLSWIALCCIVSRCGIEGPHL